MAAGYQSCASAVSPRSAPVSLMVRLRTVLALTSADIGSSSLKKSAALPNGMRAAILAVKVFQLRGDRIFVSEQDRVAVVLRSGAGTALHAAHTHWNIAINAAECGLIITLASKRFAALRTKPLGNIVLLHLARHNVPLQPFQDQFGLSNRQADGARRNRFATFDRDHFVFH